MADTTVECPECSLGTIEPGGRCTVCGLAFEDMEAAAEHLEAMLEEALAERRGLGRRGNPHTEAGLRNDRG